MRSWWEGETDKTLPDDPSPCFLAPSWFWDYTQAQCQNLPALLALTEELKLITERCWSEITSHPKVASLLPPFLLLAACVDPGVKGVAVPVCSGWWVLRLPWVSWAQMEPTILRGHSRNTARVRAVPITGPVFSRAGLSEAIKDQGNEEARKELEQKEGLLLPVPRRIAVLSSASNSRELQPHSFWGYVHSLHLPVLCQTSRVHELEIQGKCDTACAQQSFLVLVPSLPCAGEENLGVWSAAVGL